MDWSKTDDKTRCAIEDCTNPPLPIHRQVTDYQYEVTFHGYLCAEHSERVDEQQEWKLGWRKGYVYGAGIDE